jgi:hypothetical protein
MLAVWLRGRDFFLKWYEWLLAGIGLALLIFGLQNYWATRAEHWSIGTPLTSCWFSCCRLSFCCY